MSVARDSSSDRFLPFPQTTQSARGEDKSINRSINQIDESAKPISQTNQPNQPAKPTSQTNQPTTQPIHPPNQSSTPAAQLAAAQTGPWPSRPSATANWYGQVRRTRCCCRQRWWVGRSVAEAIPKRSRTTSSRAVTPAHTGVHTAPPSAPVSGHAHHQVGGRGMHTPTSVRMHTITQVHARGSGHGRGHGRGT